MARRYAGLGVSTRLRVVSTNGKSSSKKKVVMKISEKTFERLKENSFRYGEVESYDEILIRLLDFYEQRK